MVTLKPGQALRPRRRRDPRQARFLTLASLRWVLRHHAYTPWYLLRYLRLARLRLRHPDVVLEGMVFLGRDVEIAVRTGYGRLVLGRWVHIGEGTSLRAHEGTLRIGDKVVMGRDNTLNCYLDVEIGDSCLIADDVYVTDFDHVTADLQVPIKDQGIVKSPVRIGPDVWLGAKVVVTRGTTVGRGAVLAAGAVVTRDVPEYAVAGGVPARVIRSRVDAYVEGAAHRAALADMARKAEQAARGQGPGSPASDPSGQPEPARHQPERR